MPASEMVKVELNASEVMVMFPLALPDDLGEKVALKVMLCPGVRDNGGFRPLILKPAPETLT